MNFLYYKNFGEEKAPPHAAFKKKKDVKKTKSAYYGGEGHPSDCQCDQCYSEYPLRTHLLLNMSFSRQDQDFGGVRRKSTGAYSKFSFFSWNKKPALGPPDDQIGGQEAKTSATGGVQSKPNSTNKGTRAPSPPLEPMSIAAVKQDCFMIPITRMSQFFPAGHPIPTRDAHRLRMLETAEPSTKIVFHLIGPARPFLPTLTSPLYDLHRYQQDTIVKAFRSTVSTMNLGTALQGMVLLNLEKGGELGAVEFPFMIVWIADGKKADAALATHRLRQQSLDFLDPGKLGYTCNHYIDSFDEVATLARPPLEKLSRRASTPETGYIISVFQVFAGDDNPKFERNWLQWTGAKTLYQSMTSEVGLRRLTLHKSSPQNGIIHYILMCECSEFLSRLASAVKAVPKLRMRLCGDTGLYRPVCTV